jgi:hypothetical protein
MDFIMLKKKKTPKGALVTAAKGIGKAAGRIVAVVSDTAEKAKSLAGAKPAKKARKKKPGKKSGFLPKIKKLVRKSK